MTIRNTSEEMQRNDKRVEFLARGVMGESTDDMIRGMESQGQEELCGQTAQLPTKCHDEDKAALEAAGVKFGEVTPGDEIFRSAELPPGWKIVPTDHPMWSHLVDAEGAIRGEVFYKAAFYDRRAHLHARARYQLDMEVQDPQKGDSPARWKVIDNKTFAIINAGAWREWLGTGWHEEGDEMRRWLEQKFPHYRDPAAYWEDE